MHDWSDEKCQTILRHITAVMEKGYSKLLIEDYILSDQNPAPRHTMTDMIVMVFCSGMERTKEMWTELLNSVGLDIVKFWTPDGDGLGIIEAELRDTDQVFSSDVITEEPQPALYNHINGRETEILDRYCVSELCKGCLLYHDDSEWSNYRDLFVKDGAYVWTC